MELVLSRDRFRIAQISHILFHFYVNQFEIRKEIRSKRKIDTAMTKLIYYVCVLKHNRITSRQSDL